MALALGATVAELQGKMSPGEIALWSAYRKKHGGFSDARRYDRPAALISMILSRLHGAKREMKDFMPFMERDTVTETLEDIAKQFGGLKVGKRKSR